MMQNSNGKRYELFHIQRSYQLVNIIVIYDTFNKVLMILLIKYPIAYSDFFIKQLKHGIEIGKNKFFVKFLKDQM